MGYHQCAWTTRNELLMHKANNKIKIVERDYGCGATDSTAPIVRIFKTREVTNFFIFITEVDTSKIDKTNWIKIKESEK